MKFHIVRDGETVKDIMFLYSISEDELKEENRHIRKWDSLVPGTKLKIAVITNTDDEDIMQMEPFIEDYYPKEVMINNEKEENIDLNSSEIKFENNTQMEEINNDSNISNEQNESKNVEHNSEVKQSFVKQNNYRPVRKYIYYPYYVYYPYYGYNYYSGIKKRYK